ncbi:ROK family protein [Bacillaceae bacterium SIJ1]|uniref:ROK family protein n=1 Tax=Litoribacterium kuwaitense TaxID=1398745 RepID=UPI0013EA6497|nr:ROK family protein [Litoribacterium kuwaitense]NGP45952.1 ROK family protein [Litoribacterium kuwaitense]
MIAAAQGGDELARRILDEAGRYIGIALTTFIHFFDPEVLLIGGSMVNHYEPMMPTIADMMKKRALLHHPQKVQIQNSSLGERAGLIGAATLVLQSFFDEPNQVIVE